MDPTTVQFEVPPNGEARPGFGVIAAYVPAAPPWPGVVALAADPLHDPGRPIDRMAPAAVAHVIATLAPPPEDLCWVTIDAWGRFVEAVPRWIGDTPLPQIEFRRFRNGAGSDAFLAETGAAGEVALEMLAAVTTLPNLEEELPSEQSFLDAIEFSGNLPVPGAIFKAVEDAVAADDTRKVAALVQADPVIASSLLSHANAARFAGRPKTASVLEAVIRLGLSFVRRVVFVASMMKRYRRGQCREFDYQGYWMNAMATGSAMRALMPKFEIPARMADDAFAAGLVAGIGWLAISETYPALMANYLKRCRHGDALAKIRAQKELFPCPIRLVSERYLQRLAFPDIVLATVAGKTAANRNWGECLAHAVRVAQKVAPFDCLAVMPLTQLSPACEEEWASWQDFLAGMRR
ncbi:MAG: HDOD domain-containing protein [Rhodocyclales bacterium]|nr:HDOD domain-containing protein [Rhodocyclales bacterium]